MKNTLLILFLLTTLTASAQRFYPKGSLDYFVGGNELAITQTVIDQTGTTIFEFPFSYGYFRARIGAEFKYRGFSAYFDQKIYMNKSVNISFRPLQAEWYAGISYTIFSKIKLTYEHLCIHPINSGSYAQPIKLYGGYDMFSISFGY